MKQIITAITFILSLSVASSALAESIFANEKRTCDNGKKRQVECECIVDDGRFNSPNNWANYDQTKMCDLVEANYHELSGSTLIRVTGDFRHSGLDWRTLEINVGDHNGMDGRAKIILKCYEECPEPTYVLEITKR